MCDHTSRQELLLFLDGTNNTLTGGPEETNVARLHRQLALAVSGAAPPALPPAAHCVLYYDPGVGNSGGLPAIGMIAALAQAWQRIEGLALGRGVYDNIASAYRFLVEHWQSPGDEIYLFGFSRGAYTARAVAGMVDMFGLIRPQYVELIPTLVHVYFSPPAGSPFAQGLLHRLRRAVSHLQRPLLMTPSAGASRVRASDRDRIALEIRDCFAGPGRASAWIHWIGVWDTVESVGLPGTLSQFNPNPGSLTRFDATAGGGEGAVVGKRYRHIRHVVSLDEHRSAFRGRLYDHPGDLPAAPPAADAPGRAPLPTATFKQRWHAGDHCDVGGSHPDAETGLSSQSLQWMKDELAPVLGIALPPEPPAPCWRHDSLWSTPFWGLAPMIVRTIPPRLTLLAAALPTPWPPAPAHPAGIVNDVWQRRRAVWPLLIAALSGYLVLLAEGQALLPPAGRWHPLIGLPSLHGSLDRVGAFWLGTLHPLAEVCSGCVPTWLVDLGLPDAGPPWQSSAQPGWAAFWDLVLTGCWGYGVARIGTRVFARFAGARTVQSRGSGWLLLLGWIPCLAVAGRAAADGCIWLALAAHGSGVDTLAFLVRGLGALATLVQCAGLLGCVCLVLLRLTVARVARWS